MDILLNQILHLTDEEIENCKIELNTHDSDTLVNHVDTYLRCLKTNREEGTCKGCSYWGWKGGKKEPNYKIGELVFSFIRTQEDNKDEWLLISAGTIKNIPENDYADVLIDNRFKPFFGRLFIKYKKIAHQYVFDLQNLIDKITVKEILPSVYDGEPFPGYDKVNVSFTELENYINKTDWKTALENQKAVYLLTDTQAFKFYVGSAYGDNGMLLSRWKEYLETCHGGNKELKKLVNTKGFDYIKDNFKFSILETFNKNIDKDIIINRESWWKDVLKTKINENGYNDN